MYKIEKYVSSLSPVIQNSITWYTGSGYEDFNTKLRKGEKLDYEQQKHFLNLVEAFKNVPLTTESITVYKGKKSENLYNIDSAFISTSINIKGTKDFRGNSCCLMVITVPPGSKILPIKKLSDAKYEDEILLDRNGKLVLTAQKPPTVYDGYDLKTFYITYLPSTAKEIVVNPPENKRNEELNSIVNLLKDMVKEKKEGKKVQPYETVKNMLIRLHKLTERELRQIETLLQDDLFLLQTEKEEEDSDLSDLE